MLFHSSLFLKFCVSCRDTRKLNKVDVGNLKLLLLLCTDAYLDNMLNAHAQVLNAHVPVKKKIQRFNNNPFMTKQLRKAIMHRSRLKNVFNKNRTPKTWDSYKKQRNFCVNLLRKTKKSILKISMLRI